jgi:hypothetical protein
MVIQDYESSESQTFFPQVVGHSYNLTAEFADVAAAQRAHQGLRDAGVAGEQDLLMVPLGEEVSTRWGLCADDRIRLSAIIWWIGVGLVVGTLLGGLLGLVVGLIVIGRDPALWEAVVAGLVFGAGAGGMTGGMSAAGLRVSTVEAHRRHPELDHALLYVQTSAVDRAAALLTELAAVRVTPLQPSGPLR